MESESGVRGEGLDEELAGGGLVMVMEESGDGGELGDFESVTEEKSEEGRKKEDEGDDAAVAINVEAFFGGDAEDGSKGSDHEGSGERMA